MSKGLSKKTAERRKKARGSSPAPSIKTRGKDKPELNRGEGSRAKVHAVEPQVEQRPKTKKIPVRKKSEEGRDEACFQCGKDLRDQDKALLVEEELARVFCTEDCIAGFFNPDIQRLEKEYFRYLSDKDLSGEDREKFAHLRWITLEEPDEVWREKTLTGDHRYTLISEFQPGNRTIWCVCICLFLRGEPSFLYLAFPSRNAAMVNHYRRGERVQWLKKPSVNPNATPEQPDAPLMDGLADDWTEEETRRAQMNLVRKGDDIPAEEYGFYQSCMDETLEEPQEVWSIQPEKAPQGGDKPFRVFHFIRAYPEEGVGMWFVIVARETEDPEQIEILDAFPTRDGELVDQYRRGDQEVGGEEAPTTNRLVH